MEASGLGNVVPAAIGWLNRMGSSSDWSGGGTNTAVANSSTALSAWPRKKKMSARRV